MRQCALVLIARATGEIENTYQLLTAHSQTRARGDRGILLHRNTRLLTVQHSATRPDSCSTGSTMMSSTSTTAELRPGVVLQLCLTRSAGVSCLPD